jgi:hypothetical protein
VPLTVVVTAGLAQVTCCKHRPVQGSAGASIGASVNSEMAARKKQRKGLRMEIPPRNWFCCRAAADTGRPDSADVVFVPLEHTEFSRLEFRKKRRQWNTLMPKCRSPDEAQRGNGVRVPYARQDTPTATRPRTPSALPHGVQVSKSPRNTQSGSTVTSNAARALVGPDGLAVADRLTFVATVLNLVVVENVIEPALNVPLPSEVPPHEPAVSVTCVALSAVTFVERVVLGDGHVAECRALRDAVWRGIARESVCGPNGLKSGLTHRRKHNRDLRQTVGDGARLTTARHARCRAFVPPPGLKRRRR